MKRRCSAGERVLHRSLGLLLGAGLVGCTSLGPGTVPADRFDYSSAIARSRNEQMLLNIVRLRYLQMPDFLTVSSVIAGYTYQGGLGVGGQVFDQSFLSGTANLNYTERPTITYTPLSGEEFSRRMLKTIPVDVLFALGESGWPSDILWRIAVQRIGGAQNMTFAPTGITSAEGLRAQAEDLVLYGRVVRLMLKLQARGAFEVVRSHDEPEQAPTFSFAHSLSPELRALVDELKGHLGLAPDRDTFQVTDSLTAQRPDQILIQTRSMLAIMSFLAEGVEVPEADVAAKRAVLLPREVQRVVQERGSLRIHSQSEPPDDPYTAVRYRGHWFYVDGGDQLSKRTFTTVLVLFELLAPGRGGAAPLLSLPTG